MLRQQLSTSGGGRAACHPETERRRILAVGGASIPASRRPITPVIRIHFTPGKHTGFRNPTSFVHLPCIRERQRSGVLQNASRRTSLTLQPEGSRSAAPPAAFEYTRTLQPPTPSANNIHRQGEHSSLRSLWWTSVPASRRPITLIPPTTPHAATSSPLDLIAVPSPLTRRSSVPSAFLYGPFPWTLVRTISIRSSTNNNVPALSTSASQAAEGKSQTANGERLAPNPTFCRNDQYEKCFLSCRCGCHTVFCHRSCLRTTR